MELNYYKFETLPFPRREKSGQNQPEVNYSTQGH